MAQQGSMGPESWSAGVNEVKKMEQRGLVGPKSGSAGVSGA